MIGYYTKKACHQSEASLLEYQTQDTRINLPLRESGNDDGGSACDLSCCRSFQNKYRNILQKNNSRDEKNIPLTDNVD